MASLRHIAVALAHTWFVTPICSGDAPPTRSFFLIRGRDIRWGIDQLSGKRIRVEITLEDDVS
jgi:hypothetical protein